MAWLVMNNERYLAVNQHGEADPVGSISDASVFETKKQADDTLRRLSKVFKKLGYRVAPTKEPVNTPRPKIMKPRTEQKIQEPECGDLYDPDYYLTELRRFRSFIGTITAAKSEMAAQQYQAELEIEDILHAAEFYDLDKDGGNRLYRMLRESCIHRRRCKDAGAWISLILGADPVSFLYKDPSERIADWNRRSYHPRALPDLFRQDSKDGSVK